MIDEFQDLLATVEQFLPLVRESLASNHFNLIVGDVKQSIYRFRNGDWRLLEDQIDRDFHLPNQSSCARCQLAKRAVYRGIQQFSFCSGSPIAQDVTTIHWRPVMKPILRNMHSPKSSDLCTGLSDHSRKEKNGSRVR
jgi:hypothetical protein